MQTLELHTNKNKFFQYMTIAVNSLVRCIQDEETIKQHTWTAAVLASQDQMDTCLKKLIENT